MTVSSFNGGKEMNNTDKHLIACNDPFHSVVSSFDVVNGMDTYLLGVKNDNHIPSSFVRRLEKQENMHYIRLIICLLQAELSIYNL